MEYFHAISSNGAKESEKCRNVQTDTNENIDLFLKKFQTVGVQ